MNANNIINDDMTLEEKLAAIDAAIAKGESKADNRDGRNEAPEDPADLLMCEGCQ